MFIESECMFDADFADELYEDAQIAQNCFYNNMAEISAMEDSFERFPMWEGSY